ncbi:GNAT family N-acyltransferase [Marinobacterium mangrovicola]|uniref:L-ornithine N(alpha)-acyltransferase n=1 Tax=Marinobacterium mangrovicola TaxID=1476959 RepID=A0A4R1GNJ8_9GAMM|nr:lysophospholipid acyltransferase family protein [Marinobacterium mangrovicola]TCK08465.1 putative hemolysin [Marinobacterium mangrovicola]
MQINVEQVLLSKYPGFATKPSPVRRSTLFCLRRLVREGEINRFLEDNREVTGFEFIDRVLDYFNFSYSVSAKERINIPSSGRVVIVANHPLGALDGLALLKLVGEVRRDVRIIANDVLMHFDPLQNLFLPVDNLGKGTRKKDIARIVDCLRNEEAVIVFPAGEVSRAGFTGIKDGPWNSGFLMFARRSNAPILPIHVGGKNSALFYGLSTLKKSMSTLLLAQEMFNKRERTLPIRIGETIPFSQLDTLPVASKIKAKLLKKHLYRIARNKSPLFKTEKTIAHPQNRQLLKQELRHAEQLGQTADGKKIYLFDYRSDSAVMAEIGRLREVAFRCVGEGTGARQDLDNYDRHYKHLILWDEDDLEIAGAYRLAEPGSKQSLYSASLFSYNEAMKPYLAQGIELGRSFVQPRYWGRRSLDYLWYGIGAYLRRHPEIRYLFGPVSLSNSYPKRARDLLVWFYRHYFPDTQGLGRSKNPYVIDSDTDAEMRRIFDGQDYSTDFAILKAQLEFLGVSVPTLYKQYSELCEPGGVRFLDFGVDADFNFCVDGLVLVDTQQVKARKRQRYIGDLPQMVRQPPSQAD